MNRSRRIISRVIQMCGEIADTYRHEGARTALEVLWHRVRQSIQYRLFKSKSRPPLAVRTQPRSTTSYAPTAPPKEGILFVGYVEAGLGLGESLRNLIDSTALTAVPFAIYPFNVNVESRFIGPFRPECYDCEQRFEINVIEIASDQLPSVMHELGEIRTADSYNILRTYWELPQAPQSWAPILAGINEIWAPTTFVADAFRPIFAGTITLIPPCVEIRQEISGDRTRFGLSEEAFYFIFSFDYFSFPARKNPVGVVRAFQEAFPRGDEKVGLIIKSTSAPDQYPEIKAIIRQAARHDSRIKIIDRVLTRSDILSLINCSDCYVSLHRSEGFGLGMVEAMALGKPVIGTAFSGNTDFLTEQTGFPVPYARRPVRPNEYVYADHQSWAEPDQKSAVEIMRIVAEDRDATSTIAQNGRAYVSTHYGRAEVARRVEARIAEIRRERLSGHPVSKPPDDEAALNSAADDAPRRPA